MLPEWKLSHIGDNYTYCHDIFRQLNYLQITEDNHRNDRFQPAECQKPKTYIITVL